MRISDWSSDVCSSDLPERPGIRPLLALHHRARTRGDAGSGRAGRDDQLGCVQLLIGCPHGASGNAELGGEVLPGGQAGARVEHAAFDRGRNAVSDLLGEWLLGRAVDAQVQWPRHAAVVHYSFAFLVLLPGPARGHLPCSRRRKPMKIRTIITAICAALALSMAGPGYAHDDEAESVTTNFEAAIPNIPGKSLIALEVDYAPGAASPSHTHAKSAFIYAYVISGAIESKVNDGETQIYRDRKSTRLNSSPSCAYRMPAST